MKEKVNKYKKWIWVGAGLLVILVAVGVIRYSMIKAERGNNLKTSYSEEMEQPEGIIAWGEVRYEKIYDINIDFPSTVTQVKVKEGDHVSMGQELVTLDMSEYRGLMGKLREQLKAGEAGLMITEQDTVALLADIAQLQKDIKTKTNELNNGTNADLEILQTSLALAKKEVENAQTDVNSNQELYDVGSISKSALDQYISILDQRKKVLSDVESNIEKTRSFLRAELDQMDILLKAKQAQLEQITNSNYANTAKQDSGIEAARIDLDTMENKSAKDYLKDNSIVSSVKNGIVQNIGVINGTMLGVQNMPTRVLQLIDADTIVVSAEIDEEFIKNVTMGQAVHIVPTADNSLLIPGIVSHISNVAIEKDGKRIVKVEVKPQDTEGELKPGYSVDVFFFAK
jgi:multidrug resistance efflux pump